MDWNCYTAPAMGVPFWPDKMVDCDAGVVWYCEVKAVGTRHDKTRVEGQKAKLRQLHRRGFPASFCVGNTDIDEMMSRVMAWIINGRVGVPPCLGIYEDCNETV